MGHCSFGKWGKLEISCVQSKRCAINNYFFSSYFFASFSPLFHEIFFNCFYFSTHKLILLLNILYYIITQDIITKDIFFILKTHLPHLDHMRSPVRNKFPNPSLWAGTLLHFSPAHAHDAPAHFIHTSFCKYAFHYLYFFFSFSFIFIFVSFLFLYLLFLFLFLFLFPHFLIFYM
jgi:hypothetical protein